MVGKFEIYEDKRCEFRFRRKLGSDSSMSHTNLISIV